MAYLIDTSVWARDNQPIVKQRLLALTATEEVWTCRAGDLEVAYNSRARDVARDMNRRRYLLMTPITQSIMERSVDIAVALAASGLHRHAKSMDLIIAAAAESAGLSILHYDRGFDHIASVTGQPTEWISPPGTLD